MTGKRFLACSKAVRALTQQLKGSISRSFTPICCDSPVVSDIMSCRFADIDAIICTLREPSGLVLCQLSGVIQQTAVSSLRHI